MNAIVLYKSKYGSTKQYAEWISTRLDCDIMENKKVNPEDLLKYDTIILGGGLYAEVIAGANLIEKNYDLLKDKKLIVYTTGLTPPEVTGYYEMVYNKNFKKAKTVKMFNFLGKMVVSELSVPHKLAINTLKKLVASGKVKGEGSELLESLCDLDGDFSDKKAILPLVEYAEQ